MKKSLAVIFLLSIVTHGCFAMSETYTDSVEKENIKLKEELENLKQRSPDVTPVETSYVSPDVTLDVSPEGGSDKPGKRSLWQRWFGRSKTVEQPVEESSAEAAVEGEQSEAKPGWLARGRSAAGSAYKSAKDFAGRHRGKILAGVAIAASAATIYALSKNPQVKDAFSEAKLAGYKGQIKDFITDAIGRLPSKASMTEKIKGIWKYVGAFAAFSAAKASEIASETEGYPLSDVLEFAAPQSFPLPDTMGE